MQLSDKRTAATLAALIVIFFFINLFFLFQSALLPGQDAPYYLRGLESIQSIGFLPGSLLEWPPVFFYASAVFAVFFGTVEGIKISAALFAALLALSVFVLSKQLFKSNEAALVAAFFVLLAPVSMRLLNGFWKTSAALFFLPLFFYFFLRSREDKKNLLFAFLMLLLVFLSHKYVAMLALLVLLVFVPFLLVFERKITSDAKNATMLFAVFVLVFCAVFFASQNGFSELLSMFGLINSLESSSSSSSLWQYYGALVIPAFFGALYCFFNAKREHLFLLCWFLLGLFVAMPASSGSNYWRFAFLLALPFSLLAGLFFVELKKELGALNSLFVFLVIAALVLPQFYNAAAQIVPIYNEKELVQIKQLSAFAGNALVLSKGPLLQWLQYYKVSAFDAEENFLLATSQQWIEGRKAFVAFDKQREMLDFSSEQSQLLGYFETAFAADRFFLLKPDLNFFAPGYVVPDFSKYSRETRIGNLALWLFFPAEFFNLIGVQFASVLRALVGLPLSFALIAFVLLQLKKFDKKNNFRFAAFVFIAFLVFLVAIAK